MKLTGPAAELVTLGHITWLFFARALVSRQGWHEVKLLDDKAVIHWSPVGEMEGKCVGSVTQRLHMAEVVESSRWTFLKVIHLVRWWSYVYTHDKMIKAKGIWDLNSFWWMRDPLRQYCPSRRQEHRWCMKQSIEIWVKILQFLFILTSTFYCDKIYNIKCSLLTVFKGTVKWH